MEHLHDIAVAYWIGWIWGAVRHLSSNLISESNYPISWRRVVLWFVVSWGFGVLVLFVALYFEKVYWLDESAKYAMIYVGGMLSRELIKIIINKMPDLFSKKLDKLWEK